MQSATHSPNDERVKDQDDDGIDDEEHGEGKKQDEKTDHQFYKPNISNELYILTLKLFKLLDQKSRGYLNVKDFVRLGYAMTEEKPTIAAAEFMLEQANISGTGRVDQDEWMGYAERLKDMPNDLAIAQLTAFVNRLERNNQQEYAALERKALKSLEMDDV
jgi:hypothetical protein